MNEKIQKVQPGLEFTILTNICLYLPIGEYITVADNKKPKTRPTSKRDIADDFNNIHNKHQTPPPKIPNNPHSFRISERKKSKQH